MRQLLVKPEIYEFSSFKQFDHEFSVGQDDLLLTNRFIYERFMISLGLQCRVIFQEDFGSGEPSDIMIAAIAGEMNKKACQRVIAVGGGTIIDIAKVLILENAMDIDRLYEAEVLNKNKTLIIIPTTCGTGSEVTNISIINRTRKGTKQGLVSPAMFADYAVLIPELLKSLPHYVFATSSIDALIHAAESYLSPANTPFSEVFSKAAVEMILGGYCQIIQQGDSRKEALYESFLRAATFAGIAFGNSGCAAVHAMSYALGGKYHVPHGESNYVFFTAVLRKYQEKAPDGRISILLKLIKQTLADHGYPAKDKAEVLTQLDDLLEQILEKRPMSAYGAADSDMIDFARSTVENQQRLLRNNYVYLSEQELLELFQERL